jgi:hypothetical protein
MWLTAHRAVIAKMAGLDTTADYAAALECAELLIERFTKCKFVVSTDELRINLGSRTLYIVLPRDVMSVTNITKSGQALEAGQTPHLGLYGLELYNSLDEAIPWTSGSYLITVQRGFSSVPSDILKAASLLLAWYVGLSDPERSRYAGLNLGDFTGDMRLSDFPVPEARVLLQPYRNMVQVSL